MIENCEDHIAALNSHAKKDHTTANLLTPIVANFTKVVNQLKHHEVELIGKIDGKPPHSHDHPPHALVPREMAEKCVEHIAAIRGYLVDKPDSTKLLDPIVKDFEAIVKQLEQNEVEVIDKMEVLKMPAILKQVKVDGSALANELTTHVDKMVVPDEATNDEKVFRTKKYIQADLVLSKCERKLKYVLAEVEKNPAATVKKPANKGKIESDLKTAMLTMGSLQTDLKRFQQPNTHNYDYRKGQYVLAVGFLTDANQSIANAEIFLKQSQ